MHDCSDAIEATEAHLASRPHRAPDRERENRALLALADEMAERPHNVLQKLCEIILDVCDTGTAGVSLLQGEGETADFYWPAIAGAWSAFIGGVMPRSESPCGVVIQTNSALLFQDATKIFPATGQAQPAITEILLAPFHQNGKPIGTVWAITHDETRRFDQEDKRVLINLARFAAAAYQTTRMFQEAKESTERQGVLVAELQHRTRNLIGVVRSLSERTIDSASSLQDFGRRFALRLAALSRVQGLLSHLTAGQKVAFDELLRSELAALGATDDMARKVRLDGTAGVSLRSNTVQTLALALHELATNAVKYGALATDNTDGHLTVRWYVEPATDRASPRLHVEWRESGVVMPHVGAPPRGGGYGRELIERALPYQLKAKTSYELGIDGVRCTIAVPIEGLSGGASDRERRVA